MMEPRFGLCESVPIDSIYATSKKPLPAEIEPQNRAVEKHIIVKNIIPASG